MSPPYQVSGSRAVVARGNLGSEALPEEMAMRGRGIVVLGLVMLGLAAVSGTASATTLVRASVDELVAANERVVVGEVLDAVSYWNDRGDFIMTDVRVRALSTLKGPAADEELTVTVMGGTVGDLTTLILGGPELVPGRSYVLFLNQEQLPGVERATTVRDLCQGAFDVRLVNGELRAISQANSHPLVPDHRGYVDAPGGVEGFPLEALVQTVRETVNRIESLNLR
ncbi:MAG: hypothetical protein HC897_14355 [Thermoanaerobaculia bacterium]|nr:hypothetical protein [Thermoanaerobaculia bacterium]